MAQGDQSKNPLRDQAILDGIASDSWREWRDSEPDLAAIAEALQEETALADRLSSDRRAAVLAIAKARQQPKHRFRTIALLTTAAAAAAIIAAMLLAPTNRSTPLDLTTAAPLISVGNPVIPKAEILTVDTYALDFSNRINASRERIASVRASMSRPSSRLRERSIFAAKSETLRRRLTDRRAGWQSDSI